MFIKLSFITLSIFFAVDLVWLGAIAKDLYQKHLGFLMTPQVNWGAAMLFYLLFIAGLVLFVIQPALEKNSWTAALLLGAFFGLVTYATYDLTNLATVKNWPVLITVIDLIWGTVLAASVSVLSFLIAKKLNI